MNVEYDSLINEDYDNDSSGKIWIEYYKPFYSKMPWDFWNIFEYPNSEQQKEGRVYAKCKKETEKYEKTFIECELGGELDFNFNSNPDPKKWRGAKYEYYKNVLENDDKLIDVDRVHAIELLDDCKERSKKRCNFSLIIRTGGLNNVKGKMSQDKRPLDRFDVFIFILNDYFNKRNEQEKNGQKENYMHIIFSEAWHNAKVNRECLYEYLRLYRDIEDYFEKNYNISDKKLIEDLIESGSKPIDNGERVVEYLMLAQRYWDAKEDGIKKVILYTE